MIKLSLERIHWPHPNHIILQPVPLLTFESECEEWNRLYCEQYYYYCNSLYAGCAQTVLQGLQRAQSTAARLLTGTGRLESALPLMRELHWLPVSYRIQYKLCTLMYDVVHGTAPGYLWDLCRPCGDLRLRSGSRGDYIVLYSRLSMTQKSFRFSGPRAWNSLPRNVRDAPTRTAFVNKLKTHLFNLAYSWFI